MEVFNLLISKIFDVYERKIIFDFNVVSDFYLDFFVD